MVRATYLQLSDSAILMFNMHHIASDGWSMDLLLNEFVIQYQALEQALPDPLPALDIQYVDFARWQRQWLSGEVLERQLQYWQNSWPICRARMV